MRRFLTLLGVVALALTACGSDDKPATTTTPITMPTAADSNLANMILSWCVTGTSSAQARILATDAGLTAAQADFAVEQLEAMKAATDQC